MRTPNTLLQAPSLLAIRFESLVESEKSDSIIKQTRETIYMFRLQINCGAPSAPSHSPQHKFANRAKLSSRRRDLPHSLSLSLSLCSTYSTESRMSDNSRSENNLKQKSCKSVYHIISNTYGPCIEDVILNRPLRVSGRSTDKDRVLLEISSEIGMKLNVITRKKFEKYIQNRSN